MAEKEIPVVTTLLVFECEKCGNGNMQATGNKVPSMIPSEKPKMEHRCSNPKCGDTMAIHGMYPQPKYYPAPTQGELDEFQAQVKEPASWKCPGCGSVNTSDSPLIPGMQLTCVDCKANITVQ